MSYFDEGGQRRSTRQQDRDNPNPMHAPNNAVIGQEIPMLHEQNSKDSAVSSLSVQQSDVNANNNTTAPSTTQKTIPESEPLVDISYASTSNNSQSLQPDFLTDSNDANANNQPSSTSFDLFTSQDEDSSYNGTVDLLRNEVDVLGQSVNQLCTRFDRMQRDSQRQTEDMKAFTKSCILQVDARYRSQINELIELVRASNQPQPPAATEPVQQVQPTAVATKEPEPMTQTTNDPVVNTVAKDPEEEITPTATTVTVVTTTEELAPKPSPDPSTEANHSAKRTPEKETAPQSRQRTDPPEDPPEDRDRYRAVSYTRKRNHSKATTENNSSDPPMARAEVIEILDENEELKKPAKKDTSVHQIQQSSAVTHGPPGVQAAHASIPTGTATTPTVLYSAPKEVKLKLPSFHKNDRFSYWRGMCFIACATHPTMSNTILTNPVTGELELNTTMTQRESLTLYAATVEALGSRAAEVNTGGDIASGNAIAFWKKMDLHFNKSNLSFYEHTELLDELKAIRKQSNETFPQYANRYDIQLERVIKSGANPPSHNETVLQLLNGCNCVREVFGDYILNIDTDTWHQGKTIQEIVEWAETRITKFRITNRDHPIYNVSRNQKKKEKQKEKPIKDGKADRPKNDEDPFVTVSNDLRKKLKNSSNIEAALFQLYGRYLTKCPLHPKSSTHKLFECTNFARICQQCNASTQLESVLKQLNIANNFKTGSGDKKQQATKKPEQKAKAKRMAEQDFDIFEDENDEENEDEDSDDEEQVEDNDNNSGVKMYLSSSPKLHAPVVLAKTSINPIKSPRLPRQLKGIYRAVIDSGATSTMSPIKELFEDISYFGNDDSYPTAELGDEKTAVKIRGYGPMTINMHGKKIRMMGLYIPELGETTLLSVRQHIESKGCYFHASAGATDLVYPNFIIHPRTEHEIDVLIRPYHVQDDKTLDFDEFTAEQTPVVTHEKTKKLFNRVNKYTKKFQLIDSNRAKYISKKDYIKNSSVVEIKKLIPSAIVPKRATNGSIGYDVHTTTSITIPAKGLAKVPTGLAVAVPDNMYLRIAPRSGLALKNISVEAGVVDSDYRGEVKVILRNHSDTAYTLNCEDKIAQFIFERANVPQIEVVQQLNTTSRGTHGFGSTDKHSEVNPSTVKSYRVSENQVLLLTKSGPNPIIRRMNIPRVQMEPEEELISKEPTLDNEPPEKRKRLNASQEILVQEHRLSEHDTTPVDEALRMKLDEIPNEQEPTSQQSSTSSSTASPLHTEPPVTSVNSSQPRKVTISRETLSQSIGFRHPEPLLQHFDKISNGSVRIQKIPKNPQLDPGETATMKANKRNTTPLERPKEFGDVMHMDIGFGPCRAIGGIQYTLLVVDRATRHKFIYGLKNLKSSLHRAVQQLIIDCNNKIKMIRTDFDKKLIAGTTRRLLRDKEIQVQASPPYRQHQNGLVERNWQTIVDMARNWLRSAMLPTKYWYFAVKRACEVTNLLPVKDRNDKITTPYEMLFKKKVDYRVLFPMFSTAYIRYMNLDADMYKDATINKKWASDSLKCIVVGTCATSDGLLFYHPPSKKTFSCADGYKFDTFAPAGIQFNERYDGTFTFALKSDTATSHIAPTHEKNATVYYHDKETNIYIPSKIITCPIDEEEEFYAIQEIESGAIHQVKAEEVLDHNPLGPMINDKDSDILADIPWVKDTAKATLYLSDRMPKPKQGFILNKGGKWYFNQGRKQQPENAHELIANDIQQLRSLIQNKKLFQGWKTASYCVSARRIRATSNLVAELFISRKVSAKGLIKMEAPASLLKHQYLHPNDKKIWDESYRQEYQGLVDIDTWETISEDEYNNMKHLYKGLMPTMAISVIKYDGDGNPVRAKYRIVALGNLDPNHWEKSDCFAPVLSQPELRLLTAIAAKKKRLPKSADITQAFCQSYLPKGENYICKPPVGCPLTPKGRYWKLKKTLYGLKRSPRHFYDLCKKTLLEVGMKQPPTAPCLFIGHLLPGQPPIDLGVYVDDMIYFSESDAVEKKFEKDFGAKLDTGFNDKIDFFLGIQFTHKWHDNGDLTIKMSQTAFTENLIESAGLLSEAVNSVPTPYRSGLPVDSIPDYTVSSKDQDELTHQMRVLCGSLNWLAQSTRPDIATITNILSKYTSKPTPQHIQQAKRVIRYLKGTKSHGISFSSSEQGKLESFIKFPIPSDEILAMCDANWGPQDQSKPKPNENRTLELFKSRSISGYLLWYGGPLHWVSKRQTITARSSAEAEIYATDECTKALMHFYYLLDGLNLTDEMMNKTNTIYNDNNACVQWSRNTTTKGLRHIQIRENAVRESVQRNFIQVKHIEGKTNLSDMFTKEEKDPAHFLTIRDFVLTDKINRVSTREQPILTSFPVDFLLSSPIENEDFTLRGVSGWE